MSLLTLKCLFTPKFNTPAPWVILPKKPPCNPKIIPFGHSKFTIALVSRGCWVLVTPPTQSELKTSTVSPEMLIWSRQKIRFNSWWKWAARSRIESSRQMASIWWQRSAIEGRFIAYSNFDSIELPGERGDKGEVAWFWWLAVFGWRSGLVMFCWNWLFGDCLFWRLKFCWFEGWFCENVRKKGLWPKMSFWPKCG